MQEMQIDIDALVAAQPMLGIWLNWMMAVIAFSILFVWKHKAARWVLLSFILIMPTATFIYQLSGNVNLIGLAHLIFWTPLCVHLMHHEIWQPSFNPKSFYGIWLLLLLATIVISLVFDVYDVALVILGKK